MTSIYGYWTYQDLIQAYDLKDLRRVPEQREKSYTKGSIADWLKSNGYSLFLFLLQTAQTDQLASEEQFNTTLFVCDDQTMLAEYGDAFFMNLDRSSARRLLNVHSLPRIVRLPSLLTRRVIILDTKDKVDTLGQGNLTITNNRGNITVMSSRSSKWCNLKGEVCLNNGVVMILDGFFVPDNFCL